MKCRFILHGRVIDIERPLMIREDGTAGPPYTMCFRHCPNGPWEPGETVELTLGSYDVKKDIVLYNVSLITPDKV